MTNRLGVSSEQEKSLLNDGARVSEGGGADRRDRICVVYMSITNN